MKFGTMPAVLGWIRRWILTKISRDCHPLWRSRENLATRERGARVTKRAMGSKQSKGTSWISTEGFAYVLTSAMIVPTDNTGMLSLRHCSACCFGLKQQDANASWGSKPWHLPSVWCCMGALGWVEEQGSRVWSIIKFVCNTFLESSFTVYFGEIN
jgi:hypothetical protein